MEKMEMNKEITREFVELDGVVNRSGGEAGGVRAESQSRDAIAVVAEELRRSREQKRVVDGNGGVGRCGGHNVVALLVVQHRAKTAATTAIAAVSLVSFPELDCADLHCGCIRE